ncbi:MAG: DNA mismatch repair protein MutS [Clostridia bacterium]|nr:DNA mismatch repair protein MutS [Clostridia bacterium]
MLGNTPMMLQYQKIKNKYLDCILFYRLGDFYEMFGEDAQVASKILDIALTSREAGQGKRVPMCGVPFHSADNYIAKLINEGYKVAICEQVEDPKVAKGIVKREVVRIVTPGTLLENNILPDTKNNYLLAITSKNNLFGLAAVDVSTGDFYGTEISDRQNLINEILRFNPAECIIESGSDSEEIEEILRDFKNLTVNKHLDYAFKYDYCEKILLEHFGVISLYSLGCQDSPLIVQAAGAILDYLLITQKTKPGNITKLKIYNLNETMRLDYATKKNLELTQSLHSQEKKDSLLGIIDYTVTALGGRMLRNWLEQPLLNKEEIEARLNATEEFFNNLELRKKIRKLLEPIYDLERIVARISYGSANAKDLISLKNSLSYLPEIKKVLSTTKSNSLRKIYQEMDTLQEVFLLIDESIQDDPPFSLREGDLIKAGYNEEVDQLREITTHGKQWILNLEQAEKTKTGIKSLKIGFNKVFGYYIEVTKSNLHLVPEEYLRKQTLANAERFITPELKEMEARILGADDRLKDLEYQLFIEIREKIKNYIPKILEVAKLIGKIDCLASLGEVAVDKNFTRPQITTDGSLKLIQCRHPVVEEKLEGRSFIPNDLFMDSEEQRFLIITGPNMAGKSTYCRSIAITGILMQIGSFVPAKEAYLPIFDRVFARIGASDDLSTGQSTFMVEMNEVANIVNNATKDSLIILDEVGRGTSTYDGLSIAWALTEYLNSHIKAKTLFATHYHELTKLDKFPGIKNFSVSVKEKDDHIVFLHKIVPGGADRSYGIQVAKLAGLPESLIERAKEILADLENEVNQGSKLGKIETKINLTDSVQEKAPLEPRKPVINQVLQEICDLDLLNITPLEAINILYQLQNKVRKEV